jgi:hypothetical protein
MLMASTRKITGHADVKSAIATIAHEINKASSHKKTMNKAWMAGTSPAMTISGWYGVL